MSDNLHFKYTSFNEAAFRRLQKEGGRVFLVHFTKNYDPLDMTGKDFVLSSVGSGEPGEEHGDVQ